MKSALEDHDLVYYKEDGIIKSLGYRINAPRLQAEHHALPNILKGLRGGGSGCTNLAIPAGLWRADDDAAGGGSVHIGGASPPITEGLYAKLLALANRPGGRRRGAPSRRRRRKKTRRTRRKH